MRLSLIIVKWEFFVGLPEVEWKDIEKELEKVLEKFEQVEEDDDDFVQPEDLDSEKYNYFLSIIVPNW